MYEASMSCPPLNLRCSGGMSSPEAKYMGEEIVGVSATHVYACVPVYVYIYISLSLSVCVCVCVCANRAWNYREHLFSPSHLMHYL